MRTLRGRNANQEDGKLNLKDKSNKDKEEPIDDDDDVGANGDETTDDEGGVDTPPPPKDEDDDDSKGDEKSEPDEPVKERTRTRPKKEKKVVEQEADDEFEVEQIVDMETKMRWKCPVRFRVRWVGYGEKDDTWLPACDLSCEELVNEFLEISARKSEFDKAMESKKRATEEYSNGFRQSARKISKISYSELEADEDEILPSGTMSRRIQTKAKMKLLPSLSPIMRKSKKKAPAQKIEEKAAKPNPAENYEVEAIAGMREINGYPEYKVRWIGWSSKYDSWLKEAELKCPEILKNFKAVLEKLEKQKDWQVESILKTREKKGKKEFLIHWRGFESKFDTWEPEDNLEGCKDVVEKYLTKEEKGKEKLLKSKRRTRDGEERARPERFVENFSGGSRAKSRRSRSNVSYTEEEEE